MAIRAITGKPGSGKSYSAVKHIVDKYYKNGQPKVTIITNIEGFSLPHVSLDDEINTYSEHDGRAYDALNVRSYFSGPLHEKLSEGYGQTVFVIDEAQRYFPTMLGMQKWAPEVYYFFEYHRHYGYEIYLVTQEFNKLTKGIRPLIEVEQRYSPRTLGIGKVVKYHRYVDDRKISTAPTVVKLDKKYFQYYKSMSLDETEGVSRPIYAYVFVAFLLIAATFGGYKYVLARMTPDDEAPLTNRAQVVATKREIPAPFEKRLRGSSRVAEKIWVRVDWVKSGNKHMVLNPETGELEYIEMCQLPLRRIGNEIYAEITRQSYLGSAGTVVSLANDL